MKYMKYIIIIIFCFLLLLILCRNLKPRQAEKKEDHTEKTALYYLNPEENGLKKVGYSLENPNAPAAASREVILKLSDAGGAKENQYKASIFDGITVNDIRIDEGEETVDFGASYMQLSPEREILMRTAIVKSLVQIEGIDSVTFTINGDSLLGTDEAPVGAMTEDSFIMGLHDLYTQEQKVTLYYANEKGDALVPVEKTLKAENNMSMETAALLELIKQPDPEEGIQSPVPSNLDVNRTQIYNNVCYVDLSEAINTVLPDVEEKVTVYSIVNTLTSLEEASQVQFTVEGEKVQSLNEFEGFDQMMTCDYTICEQKD